MLAILREDFTSLKIGWICFDHYWSLMHYKGFFIEISENDTNAHKTMMCSL